MLGSSGSKRHLMVVSMPPAAVYPSAHVTTQTSNKVVSRRISEVRHAQVDQEGALPSPRGHQFCVPQDSWRAMIGTTSVVIGGQSVGDILYAFWLNSAALFYTRVWVELERTGTRQTLCTQHHDQTWSGTTPIIMIRFRQPWNMFVLCCGTT